MKTLIKNVHIITMDDQSSEYENGSIVIDGDTIGYIGEETGLPPELIPDRIVDGKGKLALPGFINTHTHSAMTLFRGYANDLPLWEWLSERMWPLEDKMLAEDAYWLSLLSIAEMIRAGVTTFADMYMFMDKTARAVFESGVRAVLARGLQGPDSKSDLRLKENRMLWEEWNGEGDGRIRVMVGPHAVYTCSPEYLVRCRELAQELGAGIHIHLSETRREVEECRERYGKTPVAHVLDLGILDLPVLAAHCVHLTDDDMDIIQEKGVHVSHCPASNLKLGSGFAQVNALLSRGVNVSLGTDSAASNNNLSMMKEMELTALVSKGMKEDPTLIPAWQALRMATINGAAALGWEKETGSLETGKKADIILVDISAPNYHPFSDMKALLVYSGYSGDVDTVWVDGQLLMEGRQLKTIDLEEVYREVDKVHTRIMGN